MTVLIFLKINLILALDTQLLGLAGNLDCHSGLIFFTFLELVPSKILGSYARPTFCV